MPWKDPRSAADDEADAHLLAADAMLELSEQIDRLRRQVEHESRRLSSLEQAHEWMRMRVSNVEHDSAIKDVSTDRALAALAGLCDAVLIEIEPNGQPKATAFRGAFKIESVGSYEGDWVREARGEVAERVGGALVALAAYVRSEGQDQFAGYTHTTVRPGSNYSGPPAGGGDADLPF